MNAWARISPAHRWHQVEYDSRSSEAVAECGLMLSVNPQAVMDYRWQPPEAEWCQRPGCRKPVDP